MPCLTGPVSLFAKTPSELVSMLGLTQPFRGEQVYGWLMRGAGSFSEMTNIPLSLRTRLETEYGRLYSSETVDMQRDSDGSLKLALRLYDGCVIECVLLVDGKGEYTACLSSQAGCAMGCRFCRTGTLKLKRNLFASEIIEQFMHLQRKLSESGGAERISHVVFMGMGEPLANLDEVLKAVGFLNDPKGLGISRRRITVSTCGLVPGILELAKRKIPVKLAVSLVSADNAKRSAVMPVNKAYPLEKLRSALRVFQNTSGRRFTFEYCMISGFNVSEEDARLLADFCRGFDVLVNLIPFNPCPELEYRTPSKEETRIFTRSLDRLGVEYTIRISRGRSVCGACGQLAGKQE